MDKYAPSSTHPAERMAGIPVTTALYREKAETIQASCFETNNDDGSHIATLVGWANSRAPKHQHVWTDGTRIYLEDLDIGRKVIDVGGWLALHQDGLLSAFTQMVFEISYEPLSDADHVADASEKVGA